METLMMLMQVIPADTDGTATSILNWALGALLALTTVALVYLKSQCKYKDGIIAKIARELRKSNEVIQEELRNQVKMAKNNRKKYEEKFNDDV